MVGGDRDVLVFAYDVSTFLDCLPCGLAQMASNEYRFHVYQYRGKVLPHDWDYKYGVQSSCSLHQKSGTLKVSQCKKFL